MGWDGRGEIVALVVWNWVQGKSQVQGLGEAWGVNEIDELTGAVGISGNGQVC